MKTYKVVVHVAFKIVADNEEQARQMAEHYARQQQITNEVTIDVVEVEGKSQ